MCLRACVYIAPAAKLSIRLAQILPFVLLVVSKQRDSLTSTIVERLGSVHEAWRLLITAAAALAQFTKATYRHSFRRGDDELARAVAAVRQAIRQVHRDARSCVFFRGFVSIGICIHVL